MITAILALCFLVPAMVLALVDRRRLVTFILLLAPLPAALVSQGPLELGFLGSISAQATIALATFVALSVACALSPAAFATVAREWSVFIAFLAYAGLTIVWSSNPVEGIRFLIKLLTPVLMAIVVIDSLRRAFDSEPLYKAVLINAAILCVIALVNLTSGGALEGGATHWVMDRVLTTPYTSPATFSFLVGICAVLWFARVICLRRALDGLTCLFLTICVFAAFTRISMAGLALSMSLVVLQCVRSSLTKLGIVAVAASLLVASVLLSPALRARMFFEDAHVDVSSGFGSTDTLIASVNTSGRSALWTEALDAHKERSMLFGAGLGSVDNWLSKLKSANALHSEYLRIYIDTGLVGLLLFSGALLQILLNFRATRAHSRSRRDRLEPMAAMGITLFYAVTLATDNSLNYVTEFGVSVFALLGVAIAASHDHLQGAPQSTHLRTQSASVPSNFVSTIKLRRQ